MFFLKKGLIKRKLNPNILNIIAIVLALLIPSLMHTLENLCTDREAILSKIQTNTTTISSQASIESLWDNLHFYEDTNTESPFLFKIGFPKPLHTKGNAKNIGEKTYCVYTKGFLVKQTTKIINNVDKKLLKFKVVEQNNIEDKAIKLKTGAFELQTTQNETQLSLVTQYTPLMTPRFIWKPFEEWTNRALHKHIIESIEEKALSPKENEFIVVK